MRLATLLVLPFMASAAHYSASQTSVDGVAVVRLSDEDHKTEVSIATGVGNIAYEMKVNGKNLLYFPFASLAELKEKPALCGVPFLAPWANRLDQMAFYANGRKYLLNPELGNIRRDENKKPIHGLLMFSPHWKVTKLEGDDRSARMTSRLEFWRYPELMAQFPFAHAIEMTYKLAGGRLEVETVLENPPSEPLPVATGYHPYFQVPDVPRDEW